MCFGLYWQPVIVNPCVHWQINFVRSFVRSLAVLPIDSVAMVTTQLCEHDTRVATFVTPFRTQRDQRDISGHCSKIQMTSTRLLRACFIRKPTACYSPVISGQCKYYIHCTTLTQRFLFASPACGSQHCADILADKTVRSSTGSAEKVRY